MNEVKDIKVNVGKLSIVLSEEIMRRLKLLQENDYMQQELNCINKKIIDLYNDGQAGCGGVINPEEAMQMISILKDAMEDYEFLTRLEMQESDV